MTVEVWAILATIALFGLANGGLLLWKMSGYESKLNSHDQRLDRHSERLTSVENDVGVVRDRVGRLEGQWDAL